MTDVDWLTFLAFIFAVLAVLSIWYFALRGAPPP